MKSALELISAAEIPEEMRVAISMGDVPRDALTAMCELVARRAREEGAQWMREAAAAAVLAKTGSERRSAFATILGRELAGYIRALPVTP